MAKVREWKIESLTAANNDPIGAWVDTVASASVGQTSTQRPLYKTAQTPSGKPALYFDGINDQLAGGAGFVYQHIFVVARWNHARYGGPDSHGTLLYLHNSINDSIWTGDGSGPTAVSLNNPFGAGSVVRRDGVNTQAIENGVWHIYEVEVAVSQTATDGFAICLAYSFPGPWDIAYVGIYDAIVSGSALTTIRSDLTATYITPPPPSITTPTPLAPHSVGESFADILFEATGGTGSLAWDIPDDPPPGWSSTSLPTGGGTATTPGTYTFTVVVIDSLGGNDTKEFTIVISPPADLVITTASPLSSTVIGDSFSGSFATSGGVGSKTWTHGSGMPPGLSINSSGVRSGTSSGPAGAYTFDVTVTDSLGTVTTKSFTIIILTVAIATGIVVDKARFRYDSTVLPVILAGPTSSIGFLKIGEWFYKKIAGSQALAFPFANRTEPSLALLLRNTITLTMINGSGVTGSGSGAYTKSGASNSGAYRNTALNAAKCSIQAKAVNTTKICGLSLQNGNVTIVHDYTNAGVKHAVRLTPHGVGEIWENGSLVVDPYFKYETGDTILIELIAGLVRYYLVHADETMDLLRQTRSKLSVNPKPEIMLYSDGSSLTDVYAFDVDAVEYSTSIEIVGVLTGFQDWKEDFYIASTAEVLQMANNEPEFTYPNSKKRLRSVTASLGRRDKEDRLAYEDFFNWHGTEKEFIYVDKAKTDADDEWTEWWARFGSPMGDKSLNQCLSAHSAQIVESYRRDYVPRETA